MSLRPLHHLLLTTSIDRKLHYESSGSSDINVPLLFRSRWVFFYSCSFSNWCPTVPWKGYCHISSSNDDGLVWNNTVIPGLVPNTSDTLATHGGVNANANPTVKMLPPFVQTLLNQAQPQGNTQRTVPGVPGVIPTNMPSTYGNVMPSVNGNPFRLPYVPSVSGSRSWRK